MSARPKQVIFERLRILAAPVFRGPNVVRSTARGTACPGELRDWVSARISGSRGGLFGSRTFLCHRCLDECRTDDDCSITAKLAADVSCGSFTTDAFGTRADQCPFLPR
jgi:hypothetical protein